MDRVFCGDSITDNKGFTLIEVLIAIFIFSVGILGVATLQITSIQGNSNARQISEATNAITDRIEALLALDYNDPLLDDTNGNGTNKDLNGDGIDDSGENFGLDDFGTPDHGPVAVGAYTIRWNIAIDYPLTNTKTIRVIVEPPGRVPNFSFDMVKARYSN
ncbi:prepilin-type N-terminal cleavage/methylation domain-containing protein [Desulfobulbus alkaliphilus]|uniref:prepilin-type N-terminal cleavage/methylation domain-containing protein n=1 Tax=Desulfobulbus alkaliphilus TaxID=869814 RepID=UPI0019630EC5|nr:prepilin-type N-terminal cleavage/methylation domain-containing protein [Desulfobulbus alkaliphilus]MBM9535541.1 prepilin-type N-terminal cleavage/methylation domain-containing protein [Desulfobulbus alkaliphilus]